MIKGEDGCCNEQESQVQKLSFGEAGCPTAPRQTLVRHDQVPHCSNLASSSTDPHPMQLKYCESSEALAKSSGAAAGEKVETSSARRRRNPYIDGPACAATTQLSLLWITRRQRLYYREGFESLSHTEEGVELAQAVAQLHKKGVESTAQPPSTPKAGRALDRTSTQTNTSKKMAHIKSNEGSF